MPKCPKCGWSIILRLSAGLCRCVHCLHEWIDEAGISTERKD